ncbi:MAG TPA: urea ABC transporter permease subunit UrtC [Tepidisphaeraceae bacterium]|nr:urea ABC transporter permease subunit UrtC [Tepidisphaeraceae bacterium]
MPDNTQPLDALPPNILWTRRGVCALMLLLFFVFVPVLNSAGIVPDYKISVLGKYLCLAIVAIGIDLIWGYTGILSLCQAFFFCLGGYAMAMHLSLPQGGGDVRPEYNNIPQFMFFNNLHELPGFWKPFGSFTFTLIAGLGLPTLAATIFGFFILRSRVRGVYFSIITQAVAWGAWLLISRNEMLLGGTNGLTNFNKSFTQDHHWVLGLYLLTITMLAAVYLLCKAIARSRLGRVLVAVRDKETRLYFAGYRPYAFKVFAFAVAAMLAGLGGMLYAPQVGIITPQNMNVQASIDMVILVAVGGRGRLWGAVLGALLVNYTYASLTSDMPAAWPFVQGAMFLAVVLLFPDGIVTLWDSVEKQIAGRTGALRISMTVLPLVVIVLFLAAESLGLMPDFLQRVVFESDRIGRVALKYFVLVALLIVPGIWQKFSKPRAAVAAEPIELPLAAKEAQP